jgi:hypothetical protein
VTLVTLAKVSDSFMLSEDCSTTIPENDYIRDLTLIFDIVTQFCIKIVSRARART